MSERISLKRGKETREDVTEEGKKERWKVRRDKK